MAISLIGASNYVTDTDGGTPVVNKPGSVAADDYVVIGISTDSAEQTTPPTGFAPIFNVRSNSDTGDQRLQVWYRKLDGGEGSTFTWGASVTNDFTAWCMPAIRGADLTTFLDVACGTDGLGTNQSCTASSITPATAGALVVFCAAADNNGGVFTYSALGGSWVETVDSNDGAGGFADANVQYLADAPASAVGSQTTTHSDATNTSTNIGVMFAIRPAGGGASAQPTRTMHQQRQLRA